MVIQVKPLYAEIDPEKPYPSCTVRGSLDLPALFLHDGGSLGLQQGGVGLRTADYIEEDYRLQYSQLANNPDAALVDTPATLLLYSVRPGPGEGSDCPHVVLHPEHADHSMNRYMHHAQCSEVNDLVQHLLPYAPDTDGTDSVDLHDPCQLFASAMQTMSNMTPERLCFALLKWRAESSSDQHVDPNILLDLDDVALHNKIHGLLMELTSLRLCCVEGTRRVYTASYLFSENPTLIGLPIGTQIGDHLGRAATRYKITERIYELRVFVPPSSCYFEEIEASGHQSTLFSLEDVELCRQIGISRQRYLESAKPMSLLDKVVNFARYEAVFSKNPWRRHTGNAYLVAQWKKTVQYVFPTGGSAEKHLQVEGWKGIRGKVEGSVKTLLEHIMKCQRTPAERRKFLHDFVPECFREKVIAHLGHNNLKNWDSLDAQMGGLRDNTLKDCFWVIGSYHAMLWGNSYIDRRCLHRLLDNINYNEPNLHEETRRLSTELETPLRTVLMLVKQFYLPGLALAHHLETKDRLVNTEVRCQWIKYAREAAIYAQMNQILSAGNVSVNLGERELPIQCVSLRLGALVSSGLVNVRIPPRTIASAMKISSNDPGTRFFPKSGLVDFVPHFQVVVKCKRWGDVQWLSLSEIAHRCPPVLADIILHGYRAFSPTAVPLRQGRTPGVVLHQHKTPPLQSASYDPASMSEKARPCQGQPMFDPEQCTTQTVPMNDVIGRKVKFWSEIRKKWFAVEVVDYQYEKGIHTVLFDGDETPFLADLRQAQWDYLVTDDEGCHLLQQLRKETIKQLDNEAIVNLLTKYSARYLESPTLAQTQFEFTNDEAKDLMMGFAACAAHAGRSTSAESVHDNDYPPNDDGDDDDSDYAGNDDGEDDSSTTSSISSASHETKISSSNSSANVEMESSDNENEESGSSSSDNEDGTTDDSTGTMTGPATSTRTRSGRIIRPRIIYDAATFFGKNGHWSKRSTKNHPKPAAEPGKGTPPQAAKPCQANTPTPPAAHATPNATPLATQNATPPVSRGTEAAAAPPSSDVPNSFVSTTPKANIAGGSEKPIQTSCESHSDTDDEKKPAARSYNTEPDDNQRSHGYESAGGVSDWDEGRDGKSEDESDNGRKRKRVEEPCFQGIVLHPQLDRAKQQLQRKSVGSADRFVLIGRVAFGPYTLEQASLALQMFNSNKGNAEHVTAVCSGTKTNVELHAAQDEQEIWVDAQENLPDT